jgi:predicted metal-dependent peptidase
MNIQSIIRNDYSFTRVNRKSMHTGAVLPGLMNDETVEVAVALDMSGSIGHEDAKAFLSEVKGIMDQYADYKIDLWCFDTDVYNHVQITQDNDHEFNDYTPQGGGGTDFMANWEYMKEKDLQPKKFVMFTDGYPCGEWGDPDYVDTLFIVKGGRNESPFGQTVLYDEKS